MNVKFYSKVCLVYYHFQFLHFIHSIVGITFSSTEVILPQQRHEQEANNSSSSTRWILWIEKLPTVTTLVLSFSSPPSQFLFTPNLSVLICVDLNLFNLVSVKAMIIIGLISFIVVEVIKLIIDPNNMNTFRFDKI